MALKNLSVQLTPVEHAKKRIRRYLRKHRTGLSTAIMRGWTDSVRKGGIITLWDYQQALREMTASHEVVCTSGIWWLRKQPREAERLPLVNDDNGPLFSGFEHK